jgi:RNA-directed DNA polymerase
MKTFKHLFGQICSFENLLAASEAARRRKNRKQSAAHFYLNLEHNLWNLHEELTTHHYQPGQYRMFTIYDYEKARLISAAPFRDRVVHHALHRVIEPLFDRQFIHDSYACRTGKGTHRAVQRFQHFAVKNRYVLKCDIKKYFPSIDIDILKQMLKKKIRDDRTAWLCNIILDSSTPQEPIMHYFPGDTLFTPQERLRGIPIGNLTSQFFANVYLDGLDHFAKEVLQCKYYIRYVDDIAIFSNDKRLLWEIKSLIEEYLISLRLVLHENKCHVFQTAVGVAFLGYRIFPDHLLLRKENGYRFQRKLKRLAKLYHGNREEQDYAVQSVQAWISHAGHAHTGGLQRSLLANTPFAAMIR